MTSKKGYRYNDECDKDPYHYTECGLDDVYLLSGYETENTEYGETVSVKEADALHVAIGVYLATETKVLTGKELRFLRKEIGLTQGELGQLVGLSAQSVARWEKDQFEIGAAVDTLVRLLYLDHVGHLPVSVRELLDSLEERDADRKDMKQVFEKKNGDWMPRLAA